MTDIIEGTWLEVRAALLKRLGGPDAAQQRVRITVEELPETKTIPALKSHFASDEEAKKWVDDLKAWGAGHAGLDHPADDSRDTIYNEVVRNPR
jgi:hypothetical protein